jgi:transcriptional regulator with XRE-family HTH domain
VSAAPDSFSPDAFVERLLQMRKATGRTGANIARLGEITKQTFSGYLHTGRLPSACVLANWVFRLGINANWLLTGEGPMFLEQAHRLDDPLLRRLGEHVAALRQEGADEAGIVRSLMEMLEAEQGGEAERLGQALAE